MAMPVLSASLDKASYVPGEIAVLTVVYKGDATASNVVTITGTDQAGNAAQVTVMLNLVDRVALTVVDESGRVWALQSDDGATAVFTATV
jgi:hypothetical protein